jgi:hypothetical protein|tara:strand:- start:19678 stop:19905 length:228 start_codon:yes stop_codon:yes gene_type:complete
MESKAAPINRRVDEKNPMVEVATTKGGHALYCMEGEQGPEYYSSEIGGGVCVWITALVSPETMELALAHWKEHRK